MGLTIQSKLQFVVSGGIVKATLLDDGNPWTLGAYMEGIGGQSVRGGKRLEFLFLTLLMMKMKKRYIQLLYLTVYMYFKNMCDIMLHLL